MEAGELTRLKLVTVVAETVLRERIGQRLLEWGATGFTVIDASGKGSRGMRSGNVPGEGVRIESVVDPETAERILKGISDRYFENYAVIAWVSDVQVVRGKKYVKG